MAKKRRRKKSSKKRRSSKRKGRRRSSKKGKRRSSKRRGKDVSYGAKTGPHKDDPAWIQEEGSLGKGFLTTMSFAEQKAAMKRALKNEIEQHHGDYDAGYRSTLGKVMVLNRSGDLRKKYGKEIDRARDWFVKNYGAGSDRYKRAANPHVKRLANSLCN